MKFHPDIPYGAHKDSLKHQREVTQKLRKGEQSFLSARRRLDLIYIIVKFQ